MIKRLVKKSGKQKMEKITNETKIGINHDHIPLNYKYTAGVAGDRFLQLLKRGKFQASHCPRCNKLYLPPKIFCKDCFSQLNEWKDVREESGFLYSFTSVVNAKGRRELVALVKFDGVEGGILGKLKSSREEPKIGMKVKPVFKQKSERVGDLSDIEYFEKLNY
jgi:uncharacterized OB-fold protein